MTIGINGKTYAFRAGHFKEIAISVGGTTSTICDYDQDYRKPDQNYREITERHPRRRLVRETLTFVRDYMEV